jgi:RND family efflux transporter MFP subunit
MKKIISILIIAAIIVSGIVIVKKRKAVLNSFESSPQQEIFVDFTEIKKGNLDLKYETTGEIKADEILKIITRTEGKLEFIQKEKGDHVSKGELLAMLDTNVIQEKIKSVGAEIETLEAEKKYLKKRYLRNKALLKGNGVSKDQFDKTKSDYEKTLGSLKKAMAEKDALQEELKFSKITCPADGIVLEKNFNKNEFVSKGSMLFELENTSKGYYVSLNIPNSFLSEISDNKIIIKKNNKKIDTSVLKINPKITQNSETTEIESKRFKSKPFLLPTGSKTAVSIVRKSISGLIVPMNSVLRQKDSDLVFKINKDNKIKKIKIEIAGIENNKAVVVSDALHEKDRLVSGYPSFLMTLSDNTQVKPL